MGIFVDCRDLGKPIMFRLSDISIVNPDDISDSLEVDVPRGRYVRMAGSDGPASQPGCFYPGRRSSCGLLPSPA